MRPSHVLFVAEILQDSGYCTVDSLWNFSDQEAARIGVPRALAEGIRQEGAMGSPYWTKSGPVPRVAPTPPGRRESSPMRGVPSFEPNPRKLLIYDPCGGFPERLRSYSPQPPPLRRKSASPKRSPRGLAEPVPSSVEVHLTRQQLGRDLRQAVKPLPEVRRSCSPRRPMTLAPKRSDSPLGLGGAMADAMQRVLPQTLATGGARADGVVGWRSPGGGTAGPLLDACVQMGSASTTDEPASGSATTVEPSHDEAAERRRRLEQIDRLMHAAMEDLVGDDRSNPLLKRIMEIDATPRGSPTTDRGQGAVEA